MSPITLLRWIRRETRGALGRMGFFVACLAVGVAAIVGVSGFSTGLDVGIRREGRQLLAADVRIRGNEPIPEEVLELVENRQGIAMVEMRELVSMAASTEGRSLLAELKVVEPGYPFYGELVTDPGEPLTELLDNGGVLVDPDVLSRLGIAIGDPLLLGGLELKIHGLVLAEPDRTGGAFSLGPRVLLSAESFAATNLDQVGSRIFHRLLLRFPDDLAAEDRTELIDAMRETLGRDRGFRLETWDEALPELRRGIGRVERFLGLVALLSLLLGGVGVAQTTRAWLAGSMDNLAVLRCLGVRPGEAMWFFMLQAAALGLVGSLVGCAAGLMVQRFLPSLLSGLLPTADLPTWQPTAVLRGLGLGLGVAMLFSLEPLLLTRRVPPLRVLRRDVEPIPGRRWAPALTGMVVLLGIWAAAAFQSGSVALGGQFTLGVLAASLALGLGALVLIRLVAPPARRLTTTWLRHGLASLARPGAATVGAVVSLGLGVLLVVALSLVERQLRTELMAELPTSAPTAFLIDVLPDQWPGVQRLMAEEGAESVDSVPVVTARLSAIDGVEVADLVSAGDEDNSNRWALTREQRITYLETLPGDNRILKGALWSDPAVLEVSVEEEFATDLAVDLGSRLRFDIQGVPIELTVTSIRSVVWETFGINFFLVAEPGALDEAPQKRVATARLPKAREQRIQDRLATSFPNVTLFRIRELLEKVAGVVTRLAAGVRFLGSFAMLAGIVILGGAVSAATVRRGREIALLKTLGMTRIGVAGMLAVEYGLLGLVAGLVGTGGGSLLAWAVLTRGMEMSWSLQPAVLLLALVATILLTAATGIAASGRALRLRPIEVLRSE